MNAQVLGQPDIFSLILQVYGSLDLTIQFLNDNNLNLANYGSFYDSFDDSFEIGSSGITPGMIISYNPALIVPITGFQSAQQPGYIVPSTISFTSKYGQNLFDVNLNTYGNLENYVKLIVDNSKTDLTVNAGEVFNFTTILVNNADIYNLTTGRGYVFSTGAYSSGGSFDDSFDNSFEN